MRTITSAAALGLLFVGTAPVGAQSTRDQVKAAEEQTLAAVIRRDKAAFLSSIAPDYLAQVEDGIHDRAALASEWWSSARITSAKNDYKSIKVIGDVAIVVGQDFERSSWKGKDTSGRYAWTDVWQKRGGKWQLTSVQITKMK